MTSAGDILLAKFGIDLEPIRQAATEIKATLTELNQFSSSVEAKAVGAAAVQKKELDALKAAAQAAVAVAKQAIEQENVKTAAMKAATEELRKQVQEHKVSTEAERLGTEEAKRKRAETIAETEEVKKQNAERKLETAEIQKQIAEIRLKRQEEEKERKEGGGEGGGLISGLGRAFSRGLLGRGLAGAVAGGVAGGLLAGEGLKNLFEGATEGIEHFIEKLKEVTIEEGKLEQMTDTFQKLARGAGIDGIEYLEKMRSKTEGLVKDFDLMKVAVAGLRSPLKIDPEKITETAEAVVKLAEASGHTAKEGMDALARSLQIGNVRALSMVTDISKLSLQLDGTAPTLGRVGKRAEDLAFGLKQIREEAEKLGQTPQTLEQLETRVGVLKESLFLGFGKGVAQSTGTQTFIRMLSGDAEEMHHFVEQAEEMGRKVGQALFLIEPAGRALMEVFRGLGAVADSVGDSFNALFGIIPEKSEGSLSTLKTIGEGFIFLGTEVQGVLTLLTSVMKTLEVLAAPIGDISQNLYALATGNLQEAGKWGAKLWDDITKGGGKKLEQAWVTDWKTFADRATHDMADFDAKVQEAETKAFLAARKRNTKLLPPEANNSNRRELNKLSKLRLQEEQELAKLKLQYKQADIRLEQDEDNEAYRAGEEALSLHIARQLDLLQQGYSAKIEELYASYKAKVDSIDRDLAQGNITRPEATIRKRIALETEQAGVLQQYKANEHSRAQLVTQGAKDEAAAQLKSIQTTLQLEQKRTQELQRSAQEQLKVQEDKIKAEQDLNEKQFSQGEISPDAYFARQIDLIHQRAEAEVDAANKVLAAKEVQVEAEIAAANQVLALKAKGKAEEEDANRKLLLATEQLGAARVEQQSKVNSAIQHGEEALTKIIEEEASKRLQAIAKKFQPQQQALEIQVTENQKEPSAQYSSGTSQLLQKLVANLRDQQTELMNALNTAKPYSDTWYKIYDNIERAYQAQIKYNQQLEETRNYLGPIASLLGALGKTAQDTFSSKFVQNLGAVVTASSKVLADSEKTRQAISGAAPKDPALVALEQQAGALFTATRTSGDQLSINFHTLGGSALAAADALAKLATSSTAQDTGTSSLAGEENLPLTTTQPIDASIYIPTTTKKDTLGDTVKKLASQLEHAADAIGGFITSVMGAKSALSGGIGGAISGAGTAHALSGLPGLSFLGGPWGQAAGAIGGAALGAIIGQKNQAVQRNVDQLNQGFKQVMQQFALNTNNLQATIIQMEGLVAQARQMQSNSKKGHDQYQQVIDNYNSQLQQLQVQQHQTIIQLQQQLAVLQQPVGMQDFLGSLQEIIKQYTQFAGAASSARELADANDYLTLSLQNYEQTLETQLSQDNQQAIQDSLQLNDLLKQRYDLTNAYNGQIQGILSQGVLTRQLTQAQQKGQQVFQVQYQYQQQKDQLDEQIAATTFKVHAESQIFQLATSRIGLETQLLQLQTAQTTFDMSRISALRDLVGALASGNTSFPALAALIASMPGVSNPSIGLNDSTGMLDSLIAAAYQDRASMGFASYRGQNIS